VIKSDIDVMESIRKQNLKEIKQLGYQASENLPFLDEEMKLVRTEMDIANRINILHLAHTTSIEGGKLVSFFYDMANKNDWTQYMTPSELAYFKSGKQSQEQRANYSWNKEALLWSARAVKNLRNLKQINMATIYPLIPPELDEVKSTSR
jgi:hypothetical protein